MSMSWCRWWDNPQPNAPELRNNRVAISKYSNTIYISDDARSIAVSPDKLPALISTLEAAKAELAKRDIL